MNFNTLFPEQQGKTRVVWTYWGLKVGASREEARGIGLHPRV